MGFLDSLLKPVTVVAEAIKPLSPIVPWASAAASLYGGLKRNEQQTQAASAQQAFQQEMSGTAYQRAMADMKAAGLNPMLAAKLGGASTPSGAMPNLIDAFTPAAQTYQQAYSAESQASLQRAQETQVYETVDKVQQEVKNLKADEQRTYKAIELLGEQIETQKMTTSQIANLAVLTYEQGLLTAQDVKAAELSGNAGRIVKEFGPGAQILFEMLKALGGRR
jgi:hypothetical protein